MGFTFYRREEVEYKFSTPDVAQAAFDLMVKQLNNGVSVVKIPTDKEAEELLKNKEVKNE
jgi:hypothetical protein